VIGASRDSFDTLSYECPERFVLGVPHPTARYWKTGFDYLFLDGKQLRPEYLKQFQDARAKDKIGKLRFTGKR
jgi:hypothetical protein